MKKMLSITVLLSLLTVAPPLSASNFAPIATPKISDQAIIEKNIDSKIEDISEAQRFALKLYLAAVDIYFPALRLNDPDDVKFFFSALARSGLVYMDTVHLQKNDKWTKDAGKCLGGLNQDNLTKCHPMLEAVREIYHSSKPNDPKVAGKATLEHALALTVIEEDLFKIANGLTDEVITEEQGIGAPGGVGKLGSPNTCIAVTTPKGGGSNTNGCTMGGFAGGFTDPAPMMGSSFASMGPSGYQIDPSKVFEINCPGIDPSTFGGNVSNGGENGEGNPAKDGVDGETPVNNDSAGNDNDSEKPENGNSTGSNSDGQNTTGDSPNSDANADSNSTAGKVNGFVNGVVEKYKGGVSLLDGGLTIGPADFSSPKPGSGIIPSELQDKDPPGTPNGGYGVGFTFTFKTPDPMDDTPLMSQCGGGSFSSGFEFCYLSQFDNMDINPPDPLPPDMQTGSGGGPAMMDPELCTEFGYAGDPSPTDDGSGDGGGGPACGPSVGGKPSAECCKDNPYYPGCGGNPSYMDSLISNPGEFHTTPRMIDRTKTDPRM